MDSANKELIKQGKWNYVFNYGIKWALFAFLIIWVSEVLIFEEEFNVEFNLVFWLIGGLILGLLGWSKLNKKKGKPIEKKRVEETPKEKEKRELFEKILLIIIVIIIFLLLLKALSYLGA